MLPKSRRDELVGDLLLYAIGRENELAVMRRLVVSMALAISADDMPDDECMLLSAILDGDP